jgi:hypothetical protein
MTRKISVRRVLKKKVAGINSESLLADPGQQAETTPVHTKIVSTG